MTHFRYVPRAALWRYPSGTGVRLPRRRCRKPPRGPGCDERLRGSTVETIPAAAAAQGPDFPVEEVFDLAPGVLGEDRSRVKRRLDRLIKAFNLVRARPA